MAENISHKPDKFQIKNLFNRPTQPYANPYLGGVLLGLVLFASFFITWQCWVNMKQQWKLINRFTVLFQP